MPKRLLIKGKSFFHKCVRVWHVMRKPTRKEFEQVAKVSAIGIALIGAIGFTIAAAMRFFIR